MAMIPNDKIKVVRRPRRPTILPSPKDQIDGAGFRGGVWAFTPKCSIIAIAKGRTLREMRRRKYIIYEALRDAWRIGQMRRDQYGQWFCFGATKGHVLVRRKGAGAHLMTEREWDALDDV